MNTKFDSLYREICGQPQISYDRFREIRQQLSTIGDFSDDLLKSVNEQMSKRDWLCVQRLIFLIQIVPSTKFTEVLCDLLENHKEQGFADSIVDVLFDIKDSNAIDALKGCLTYYEVGDDDLNFNKKVLFALEEIKAREAFDAIKTQLMSEHPSIKETAEEIVKRNKHGIIY